MRNDVNNIDNLFKEGLGGYTEVPPPDVWDALERRLDNDKKKRPFLGWKWIVPMVCGVALFGSIYTWKVMDASVTTEGFRDLAMASTQQAANNKSLQAGSLRNTSAGDEQTKTSTHKKHRQTAHDITATNDNNTHYTDNTATTTSDNVTTSTAHTDILDNTAVAMAGNNPVAAMPKSNGVRYTSHTSSNNIVTVASEPTYAANDVATADEDDMTFGKRPTAEYNEQSISQHAAIADDEDLPVTSLKHTVVKKGTTPYNSNRFGAVAAANKNINRNKKTTVINTGRATHSTITASVAANKHPDYAIGNSLNKKAATSSANTSTIPTQTIASGTTAPIAKKTDVTATSKNSVVTKTAKKAAGTATPVTTTAGILVKVKSTTTSTASTVVAAKPAVAKANNSSVKTTSVIATTSVATANKVENKPSTDTTDNKTTAATTGKKIRKTNKAAKETTSVAVLNSSKAHQPVVTNKSAVTDQNASIAESSKLAKGQKTNTQPTVAANKKRSVFSKTIPTAITPVAKAGKKGNKPAAVTPPTNVIGSKPPVTPPAIAQVPPQAKAPEAKIMGTFKADSVASIKLAVVDSMPVAGVPTSTNDSNKKHMFAKYSYGIKAGYEGGFNRDASNKLVISPYIERQISSKFSLMAQPALKSSRARSNGLNGSQTFYKRANDGTSTNIDTFLIPIIQNNQTTGYLVRINVAYRETHDSIVKSYATGGNYLEFELPILLKYAINPKLSVYGGVSINYSKYIQIKENTFTSGPIKVSDTSFTIYPAITPAVSSVLQYTGKDISTYTGSPYPAQTGGLFRLGYMLGVSYEIKKRWMIDALLQKAPSKTNVQGGYDVNKGLGTTYFRFTLGYRLSKK